MCVQLCSCMCVFLEHFDVRHTFHRFHRNYFRYLGVFPDTGLVLALRITTMLIRVNTTHEIVNRHQKFFRQTTIGIIHSAMSVVN